MPVAPVDVSMQDTQGNWRRLPYAPGAKFATSAPGGPTEATIPLVDTSSLPDLEQGCAVRISDGTTGKTLWTGRLSSPVQQRRGILQSGDPSFEGQAGFLGDHFIRYTPLVTRLDAWWLGSGMKPYVAGATADSGSLPSNPEINAVMLTLPSGYIVNPYCALASFHGFYDSGSNNSATNARAIIGANKSGASATNAGKFQSFMWHGKAGGIVEWSSNSGRTTTELVRLLDPSVDSDLTLGYQYNGAGTDTNAQDPEVSADELWSGWWHVQVFRALRQMDGSLIPDWSPLANRGLLPHEIVTDLIGTFAMNTQINHSPAASVIDATSAAIITSYDFSEPASMAEILTDLNTLAPTHYWYAGTAGPDGTFPLSWLPWSGAATLLLPPGSVTYDESAGEDDLANIVVYIYADDNGRVGVGRIIADPWDYPDIARMTGFAQVEAGPLDLTSLASPSAALQVATAYLGEVATKPKSAAATVSVPVVDKTSGALLPPWTLQAGCMAHVPETGETLRVTKCDVDVDTATATLTLGTPRRTTDQIVATMSRYRKRAN